MMPSDNNYLSNFLKVSYGTLSATAITVVADLILLVSFATSYWIKSSAEQSSSFIQMGLWQYCFDRFQYPHSDKLFNGCFYIFSQDLNVIREWLLPSWLISVQFFVTLALILSLAQVMLICVIVHRPLHTLSQNEWIFVASSFILVAISSVSLLLAVAIFGSNCFRGDWLQYPSFNVLSWSYVLAVIAMMLLTVAASLLYWESRKTYELRANRRVITMG